jgi:hypothetical protein
LLPKVGEKFSLITHKFTKLFIFIKMLKQFLFTLLLFTAIQTYTFNDMFQFVKYIDKVGSLASKTNIHDEWIRINYVNKFNLADDLLTFRIGYQVRTQDGEIKTHELKKVSVKLF